MPQEQVRNQSESSPRSSGGSGENLEGRLRGAAETASEMWDDAYEQGERYYRQGTRAVSEVDPTTLTGWLVSGAIGFGFAWLIFAPSTDDMARRMAQSSHRGRR